LSEIALITEVIGNWPVQSKLRDGLLPVTRLCYHLHVWLSFDDFGDALTQV
jgi:hypothetical protein